MYTIKFIIIPQVCHKEQKFKGNHTSQGDKYTEWTLFRSIVYYIHHVDWPTDTIKQFADIEFNSVGIHRNLLQGTLTIVSGYYNFMLVF